MLPADGEQPPPTATDDTYTVIAGGDIRWPRRAHQRLRPRRRPAVDRRCRAPAPRPSTSTHPARSASSPAALAGRGDHRARSPSPTRSPTDAAAPTSHRHRRDGRQSDVRSRRSPSTTSPARSAAATASDRRRAGQRLRPGRPCRRPHRRPATTRCCRSPPTARCTSPPARRHDPPRLHDHRHRRPDGDGRGHGHHPRQRRARRRAARRRTEFQTAIDLPLASQATDADNDELTFACCEGIRGGTVDVLESSTGVMNVRFTPDPGFVGVGSSRTSPTIRTVTTSPGSRRSPCARQRTPLRRRPTERPRPRRAWRRRSRSTSS